MGTRRRRRKSKSAAVYVPVGALLIVIITVLGMSVFLRIMEIEVVGATVYTVDEIILASGIATGDNLLFLDIDGAVQSIRSAKPYISDVIIESAPPDTLRIIVSESFAVAKISHRDSVLLIDSSGRVLERVDSAPLGLIDVRGFTPSEAEVGSRLRALPDSETRLGSMLDIIAAFERAEITDGVSYLDVSNIGYITFGYGGRFRVILGSASNLNHKLTQLTTLFVPGIVSIPPKNAF